MTDKADEKIPAKLMSDKADEKIPEKICQAQQM